MPFKYFKSHYLVTIGHFKPVFSNPELFSCVTIPIIQDVLLKMYCNISGGHQVWENCVKL